MSVNSALTILITGASRGIGLELVRQYSQNPLYRVFATARNPAAADELQSLKKERSNVIIHQLDVCETPSIIQAARVIEQETDHINLLINNAAIGLGVVSNLKNQNGTPSNKFFDIALPVNLSIESNYSLCLQDPPLRTSGNKMLATYTTNVIGPLLLTQTFFPLLNTPPSTVVNISSSLGSISANDFGSFTAYRCSKAALNQLTKTFASSKSCSRVTFLALHPGHVQTELGGKNARLSVEESVAGLRRVIELKGSGGVERDASNGKFFDYKGEKIEY